MLKYVFASRVLLLPFHYCFTLVLFLLTRERKEQASFTVFPLRAEFTVSPH